MEATECSAVVDQSGRELQQHGSMEFPIACYSDDLTREEVPWHWHDELELAVVTEGSIEFKAETESIRMRKGDGCFINSGCLHAAFNAADQAAVRDGAACHLHSIVFHPRLVGGTDNSVFWETYIHPLMDNQSMKSLYLNHETTWQHEIISLTESAWRNCTDEPAGYEFSVRDDLSRIVFLLTLNDRGEKRASAKELRDMNRMKRMLAYIEENVSTELDIRRIAECAALSESECLRCFHMTIGTTPIQYLKNYRIRKAAELLRTTDQKIVDIAVECGFQDMSYFAKTFRLMKGCTPTEYRQIQR